MRQVTKEDIDTIRTPWVWDLGNRILYDMCRDHPEHSQEGEIVAKVWLIGRSYAASFEQRRNAKHIGDDFVVMFFQHSKFHTEEFTSIMWTIRHTSPIACLLKNETQLIVRQFF